MIATQTLVIPVNTSRDEIIPRWRFISISDLAEKVKGKVDKNSTLIRSPYLPEGAEVQQSFLYGLSTTYSLHRKISFGPHDLWYVILTEIARLVNASPDKYRHLFTKSPEKIDIKVFSTDPSILPLETVAE